jgi:hypothetical protein
VLQIPGTENSIVHEVMWTPWDGPGLEHLRLTEGPDTILADGLIIGTYEIGAYRLRYEVICDLDWRVKQVRLGNIGGTREIGYNSDGEGHWFDKHGLPLAELDGCIDIDISGSPFTNTLPIRRLKLQPGQSADISVLYVYVPTLQVGSSVQKYTCLEHSLESGVYRFEAPSSGYEVTLPVDMTGLVLDYPGLFRRSWISEYRTRREGD